MLRDQSENLPKVPWSSAPLKEMERGGPGVWLGRRGLEDATVRGRVEGMRAMRVLVLGQQGALLHMDLPAL